MSYRLLRIFFFSVIVTLGLGSTGCGSDSDDSVSFLEEETNDGGSNNGGGSDGGDGGDGAEEDTNNNTVAEGVQGPLDQVQTPLSEQVFAQLSGALANTPLEGTIDCAGQAVVIDVIDVLDSVALALMEAAETQDPAAAFENAAGNIQFSLEELANDLPGALTALAGDDCNGGDAGGDGDGDDGGSDNPLAGTPLAPLGDALAPVLSQFPGMGGGDGDAEDLDLQSLSALVHQLATAFRTGLAMVPAEAQEAPVFGGLLTTLDTAFADLDSTIMNLGVYDGEATTEALETTLNHLLKNVLTEVIPVAFIEAQADQQGAFTGPINDGVDQITMALGDNLLDAAVPPLADALDGPLAVLLDPIENTLLPALLGPIADGIASALGGGSGGGDGGGPTGTPLDLLLGPVTDALGGGAGGEGPTGTPLDLLLGPLLSAGGGGGCPLAGTPLEPACALFDAIPAP